MSQTLHELAIGLLGTVRDVLPIATVLLGFQLFVLRRPVPHLRRVLLGFGLVLVGMVLFLAGLDKALFPLGRLMAEQLTHPDLVGEGSSGPLAWSDYGWVYLFAALIGFSTTVAEPALIAVSMKAEQVSGGSISAWALRIAVAIGAAIGISLGAFRIVTGTPLPMYIIAGYILVSIQTLFAPRTIIAFVCLFPIMTVMAYAQLAQWRSRRRRTQPEPPSGHPAGSDPPARADPLTATHENRTV